MWRSRPPKAFHQKARRYGGLANFYTRARKELSGLASCSLIFRKNQPKSTFAKNCVEKGNYKQRVVHARSPKESGDEF